MSSDTTAAAARANRDGSQCPPWCTSDHDRVLVAGTDIYMSVHRSDPIVNNYPEPRVRVTQDGQPGSCRQKVSMLAGNGFVSVDLDNADDLADLLDGLEDLVRFEPSRLRLYADQIRAAAAIARDAK